ncbi:ketopantoate reductase PanE/ApbA C terminal-domain-containing protein [Blastocladiella britannica]|nr:ketopantoate reductase PanE/ApbA C terminal-domain-containing protein [Blastocladiella britannica]
MQRSIHILGAGNVGCLLGAQLAGLGHRVTYLVRDDAVFPREQPPRLLLTTLPSAAIEPNRTTATTTMTIDANVQRISDAPIIIDALVVTTKAHQLRGAIQSLGPRYVPGRTAVAVVQNGYGQHLSSDPMSSPPPLGHGATWAVLGSTTHGVYSSNEGAQAWRAIVHAGRGRWDFGAVPLGVTFPPPSTQNDYLLDVLGTLPDATVHAKPAAMDAVAVRKLAVNACLNALTAVAHVRNGRVASDPALRARASALAAETARVLAVARPDLPADLHDPQALDRAVMRVCEVTAENWSSTVADVWTRREVPRELEYVNGTVVRWAREHGVAVPGHLQIMSEVDAIVASLSIQ